MQAAEWHPQTRSIFCKKQVKKKDFFAKANIARGYSWLGRSRKMPFALWRTQKRKTLKT